jgi:hypothetical protein
MTSRSSQERIDQALAQIPDGEEIIGQVVSVTGSKVRVNQGDNSIDVSSISQYPLIPGDYVRLQRRGTDIKVLGPTIAKSGTGKVLVTGATLLQVEYPAGSGVSQFMPYNAAYTPVVNDVVKITWDVQGPSVDYKMTALPVVSTPVDAGAAPPSDHRQVFTAEDSGSFRAGRWWTTDVYASDSNIGAWFYGTKIKDTIPDTALIKAAAMYLPAKQVLGDPMQLGYHPSLVKPAGTVSVNGAAAQTLRSGWVSIPTTLVDVLKVADSGLGINHGGNSIFSGVATDGLSGALVIIYYS